MKTLYIGSGFVGACSAAVSADSGHEVLIFDIDQKKIDLLGSNDREKIEACLFENGLAELLIRNKDRLTFTTDYKKVEKFLDTCDAVFMCLPTPEIGETGESDLKYYFSAAEKLSVALSKRNHGDQSKYIVIVNKSTVPIAMLDKTREILNSQKVTNVGIVSNPEFLVEGKAVQGSIRPERVVVGAESDQDFQIMRQIYQRFNSATDIKYIEVTPAEAEAGKLLANFTLFNRLAVCFDVIGRTCETFPNLKFENIRKILISDSRIGRWGLYDSLYAGGSCFIKDARSLSHQLQTAGHSADLVNETYLANRRQLEIFLGRAEKEVNFDWNGKKVALLGLAFKQDTNDVRNSPSIDLVNFLLGRKVKQINCYDPAAQPMFEQVIGHHEEIKYHSNEKTVLTDADVVIIATDWPQFRGLGDLLLKSKDRPLILDGRRLLAEKYGDLRRAGFKVIAVGSKYVSSELNK